MPTTSNSDGDLLMGTWSAAKIWGGPVLTVTCVFYLYIALSNMNLI